MRTSKGNCDAESGGAAEGFGVDFQRGGAEGRGAEISCYLRFSGWDLRIFLLKWGGE